MAIKYTRLGAGTLLLGVAPGLDVSAQVVGCTLTSSADSGDSVTVLTGEQLKSGLTTESALAGSIVLDPETGGIGEYSWANHGQTVEFTFTPNTASGLIVAGSLMMLRLDIGADEFGALLNPDFEWPVVGDPQITWKATVPPPGLRASS